MGLPIMDDTVTRVSHKNRESRVMKRQDLDVFHHPACIEMKQTLYHQRTVSFLFKYK